MLKNLGGWEGSAPQEDAETVISKESGLLDPIHAANREITSIAESVDALTLHMEAEEDGEFSNFEQNSRLRIRGLIPFMARFEGRVGKGAKELVERYLGYEIREDANVVGSVHLRRVSDIMGPGMMDVIKRGVDG